MFPASHALWLTFLRNFPDAFPLAKRLLSQTKTRGLLFHENSNRREKRKRKRKRKKNRKTHGSLTRNSFTIWKHTFGSHAVEISSHLAQHFRQPSQQNSTITLLITTSANRYGLLYTGSHNILDSLCASKARVLMENHLPDAISLHRGRSSRRAMNEWTSVGLEPRIYRPRDVSTSKFGPCFLSSFY